MKQTPYRTLLAATGLSLACAVPASAQWNSYACRAPSYWQGGTESNHIGDDISVGDWSGDLVPDILAGTMEAWDGLPKGKITEQIGRAVLWISRDQGRWQTACGPAPDIIIRGEQAGDMFGFATTFLGDVDNDGVPNCTESSPVWSGPNPRQDFAVGAPRYPLDGFGVLEPERGCVYVFLSEYFMSTDPCLQQIPYSAFGVNEFHAGTEATLILEGEGAYQRLGFSIAPAGDFDGDGILDLAIGAPGDQHGIASMTSPYPGRVYIVSGALLLAQLPSPPGPATPPPVMDVSTVSIWILEGDSPADRFGYDVANVGDLGEDGFRSDDLAIGAPGNRWLHFPELDPIYDYPLWVSDQPGYIRIVFGSPSGLPPCQPHPQLRTIHYDADLGQAIWFGHEVAGVYDQVEQRSKILVGAPGWDDPYTYLPKASATDADNTGRAFLIDPRVQVQGGSEILPCSMTQLSDYSYWDRKGPYGNARYGWAVGAIGDFDGDGLVSDYAVGMMGYSPLPIRVTDCHCGLSNPLEDPEQGGRISGGLDIFTSQGILLARYVGEDSKDSFGMTVVPLYDPNAYWSADVTGDGKHDFLCAAPRWGGFPSQGEKEYGKIYLMDSALP